MTGPYHYRKADEILTQIEAANALSIQAEATLAIRAQAHATLALAPLPRSIRTGSGKNGATSQESGTRTPNDARTATPTQASDRLAACAARTSSSGTVDWLRPAARRPLLPK
jgi:hypothetical protein